MYLEINQPNKIGWKEDLEKMEEKTILKEREENKAEDINDNIEVITNDHFLEGKPYFTLMDFREDVGSQLENLVYDLVKKNDGNLTEMFYLKKVGNHIEIGAIKKIEIIKD